MIDPEPKFAVGDAVVYDNANSPQGQYGKRAVVSRVGHFDGAYWRYDVDYLDGSTRCSTNIREINLKADPNVRTVFITMPGGAEHLTHNLASDHARDWSNMTILKVRQERNGYGWTITKDYGLVDILPKSVTTVVRFRADGFCLGTEWRGKMMPEDLLVTVEIAEGKVVKLEHTP